MEYAASAGGQGHGQPVEAELRILDLPTSSGIMVLGTIDPATRASWETSLNLLVNNGGGTVDLSRLSFTDVRGMSALIDAARRVQPPRSLTIRHPPGTVRKVLRLFWPEEAAQLITDDGRPT
ncbi:STAS domain-containing protein [Amycolatopsis regifaucium]|uniref:MlaB-like STAS domain-containing protein n=1 Tax=Amycolatopsis regifaucium TaxID=546365 RepID=A0A154M3P1_9PSEU|nr:STAS domain-containing protein [Amycolatopsis regifaucium]KZB79225.1 hypothetical protein AVL48_16635 [Amycolatopsis regifaucium]OKA07408.1 hypothetical protein ATP06_0216325 [Amycolatopsis regifaucium]SFH12139.1 STAS domain-containing protein [Amycolatopsis regifaucium]